MRTISEERANSFRFDDDSGLELAQDCLAMIRKRTAIVGYGLMGGSLALALRPHLEYLAIVDTDPRALAAAASVADRTTSQFEVVASEADLVILATPVRTILELLGRLPALRSTGCMVFDLGSTKQAVGRAMDLLPGRFQGIGGHPMCGKEESGFSAASADLFEGQSFVLCRNVRTDAGIETLALRLVELVGATPLFLDAAVHDSLTAATSHLPYLVAASLVRAAATSQDERTWQVSATGFRDTSRLSGSDPRMMLDILVTNAPAILSYLQRFQEQLGEVAGRIRSQDEESLLNWLNEAYADHARYRASKGKR